MHARRMLDLTLNAKHNQGQACYIGYRLLRAFVGIGLRKRIRPCPCVFSEWSCETALPVKPSPSLSAGSYGATSSPQKSAGTSSVPQPTSAPSSSQTEHQHTITKNCATSGVAATAPSNRTKSPYARPLSAKDVEVTYEICSVVPMVMCT